MKIIDLFIKIANGEDVPKKIKYRNKIWKYSPFVQDYFLENYVEYLFAGLRLSDTEVFLNQKVEVIEEDDDEIKKIIIGEKTLGFSNGEWTARNMDKAFAIKINELIDEVNKLKRKENN